MAQTQVEDCMWPLFAGASRLLQSPEGSVASKLPSVQKLCSLPPQVIVPV